MSTIRTVGRTAILAVVAAYGLRAADTTKPWSDSEIMSPSQLNSQLPAVREGKIILLQTGFQVIYRQGHIPGSQYAGPGSKPEGLAALRKLVEKLPRNQEIIIYCGCCPWEHCPNIRPAFRALKEMGFSNVKVLDIPERLGTDWGAKGYPLTSGE